ncbi:MAG TPA: hypothetical protein VLE43_14120, partial [Candidatus Saccharimonadia bacterium]|nr:hypothetical protein [Candidatus Saccharimonadia bacterium]
MRHLSPFRIVCASVLLLAVALYFLLPRDTYQALKGLKGPLETGLPAQNSPPASWSPHTKGGPSRLA